jgi:hypothetical protein
MIHELVSREIIEGVFIGDLLEFDESGVESIELVDFNLDSSLVLPWTGIWVNHSDVSRNFLGFSDF